MDNSLDIDIALIFSHKFHNARENGINFKLSLNRVREIVEKGCCEYTGTKFERESDRTKLTLERVDPRVGYTDANTVGVCNWVNAFKGRTLDRFMTAKDLSSEDKVKILRKMVYRLEKEAREEREAREKKEAEEASKVKTVSLSSILSQAANREVVSAANRMAPKKVQGRA